MNVLVVDDSEFEQIRIRSILENLGHQVQLASNGVEALEIFAVTKPDLILLDVMMPVMDGLETARRIRALPVAWTPIVFISGNVEPEDVAAGIHAGGDDYLNKPINSVVLAAKILAMQRIRNMQALITELETPQIKQKLAEAVEIDSESGVYNPTAGQRTLAREFSRCSRSMQPVSLVLISVDHFDEINTSHGPEAALACLKKLLIALQSNASRLADFIWRQNEHTLCVVMPDTPMTGSVRVAERIRLTILELVQLADTVPFSVSAGVATTIPQQGSDSQYLFTAANNMLQRAIQDGGNQVDTVGADIPFYLTARELECLQWSAIGKSSRDISTILTISESAVNFHMANIRGKFNVSSRRQAVAQAIRYGLIRSA